MNKVKAPPKPNPLPMTNEEWLKSLDTEQFAEWIAKCMKDTIILTRGNRKYTDNIVSAKWWVEWLKQPHTVKEYNDEND